MKNYGYIGTYSYSDKPISAWGYVGYRVLWSIPVLGWLILLCAALFAKNQNKKNFARSTFCALLLVLLIVAIAAGALVGAHFLGIIDLNALIDQVMEMLGLKTAKK